MRKRYTALTFLALAYGILLGHNVVPHHHCTDTHETAHKHACDGHEDHQHEPGSEPEFCHFLNWDSGFITPTQNNSYFVVKQIDHPDYLVFEIVSAPDIEVTGVHIIRGEFPPGNSFNRSLPGLRAPPVL